MRMGKNVYNMYKDCDVKSILEDIRDLSKDVLDSAEKCIVELRVSDDKDIYNLSVLLQIIKNLEDVSKSPEIQNYIDALVMLKFEDK